MYVLHYKQHFCLKWSNNFHCVHIYNTLEGEEKSAKCSPFGVNKDVCPFQSKGKRFFNPPASPKKLNSAVLYKNVKASSM